MQDDGKTVWLPCQPHQIPGLSPGPTYVHWDGSAALTGDPDDVSFLVGPPSPGCEHMIPLLDAMPAGARPATGRGAHREAAAEPAVPLLPAICRTARTTPSGWVHGAGEGGEELDNVVLTTSATAANGQAA